MDVVPVFVPCDSDHLCRFPQGPFKFAGELFVVEPPSVVVFPQSGPQHGSLCIVGQAPGFDGGVNVFEVVEFFHPAPKPWAGCHLGLSFLFGQVGSVGGLCELCHEKEDGEDEDIVYSNGEMEPQLTPWPVLEFLLEFFDWFIPRGGDGRRSDHKPQVPSFSGPCVVGVWVSWLCGKCSVWSGLTRVYLRRAVVIVALVVQ